MSINYSRIGCTYENFDLCYFSSITRAWAVSRPEDKSFSLESVLAMDVPVNEFMLFHFTAKLPILMREIICSQRNHIVWARSSRVDDLENWEVWAGSTLEEKEQYSDLKSKMKSEMASSHQDDFRRHLPLGYMTTIGFCMTMRDLVKFLIALREENQLPFAMEFYIAVIQSIETKSPFLGERIRSLIEAKAYKPFQIAPVFRRSESKQVGDFIIVTKEISLSLRSQMIRHRALQVTDTLRDFFVVGNLGQSMESKITAQICMPFDFAEELIRKRSCWIAQTDLWEPIVGELQTVIGRENVLLPCYAGTCRFKRDNDLRKAGKDPSPPCPVAAKIEKEKMTDEHSSAAKKYLENRPNQDFWRKAIQNV